MEIKHVLFLNSKRFINLLPPSSHFIHPRTLPEGLLSRDPINPVLVSVLIEPSSEGKLGPLFPHLKVSDHFVFLRMSFSYMMMQHHILCTIYSYVWFFIDYFHLQTPGQLKQGQDWWSSRKWRGCWCLPVSWQLQWKIITN